MNFSFIPTSPALRGLVLALFTLLSPSAAVPAILVVTNPASLGPGTLRQALVDNAAMGGGHTIVFSNLAGTISLAGELTLNAAVFIRGPGAEQLAISGNDISRVITVISGPIEISDLTLRNGRSIGGEGNQMQDGDEAYAGGIWNLGTLTLSNCVVMSNTVVGGLGGERAQGLVGRGGHAYGGGIYHLGNTLRLLNTKLIGNSAQGGGGGVANNGNAGPGGDGFGGGVYGFGGTIQIVGCEFSGNTARGGNGGNSGGNGAGGNGGVGSGGGSYQQNVGLIAGSTFDHCHARGGVGGAGQTIGFSGPGFGGGLYVLAELALLSSTVASNLVSGSATDWGGGLFNGATDFLGLTNCTVTGNQADASGGIHGSARLANCIVAGNSAVTGPDLQGLITSADYNLIQTPEGATLLGETNHTLMEVDPLLGPLRNNGGPTRTMALLPGSPALDRGKSFGLVTDQRGLPRPHDLFSVGNATGGDGADIGAFEFLPSPVLNIQPAGSGNVVLFWTRDAADYPLEAVTNLPPAGNWSVVNSPRYHIGDQTFVTNAVTAGARFYRLRFAAAPLVP